LTYNRILVPFDVSLHAEKALGHAVKLAELHKSEIFLLHVIPEFPLFPLVGYTSISPETQRPMPFSEHVKAVYEESQKYLTQMLKVKAMAFGKPGGAAIKADVLLGDPVNKIVEYAENNNIDLIVMGSVGLGGLAKFKALGTVSRGIAERASCPVMIIH
jgi:nucleotide-binding universal stress UspA family protein